MTVAEQKGEGASQLAHDDRTDVVAALRDLGEKIDGHIERQNEGLMRLGYSTATLNSTASESLAALKMLGDERKKLAEIIARPAALKRQRGYMVGALVVGLVIGLVVSTVVVWLSGSLNSQ
jgi:hypothetical protein